MKPLRDIPDYCHNGVRLHSVTEVIEGAGLGADYSMVPPDVLERKRQIGEAVHAAAHYADQHDLDESSLDPAIVGYVRGYQRFLVETGFEVVGVEERLRHPELGYAGTPDRWGFLQHTRVVVDLKSLATLSIPPIALQNAAYARLIEAHDPSWRQPKLYALQLRKDGTYRLVRTELPAAEATFLAALSECRGEGTPDAVAIIADWRMSHGSSNGRR